jgi:hypothetical protein
VTDPKRAATMRAAWRRLLAQLRAAPSSDAEKLVNEMRADIETLFPTTLQPRGANVVSMAEWLVRSSRANRR